MKELAAVALPLTMAGLWRVDVIESSLNYREGLLLSWALLDGSADDAVAAKYATKNTAPC
jgi:hypothetical protein